MVEPVGSAYFALVMQVWIWLLISNDRGSGRRPPLPRSRPQKLGNGRPPEVVYIRQARFTSLSLSLRRF